MSDALVDTLCRNLPQPLLCFTQTRTDNPDQVESDPWIALDDHYPAEAAAVVAALLMPWWAGALAWGIPLGTSWPPSLWHGHEMLFGFITAAVAGFLLTAVPSWTGERGFAGWPLIVLATLWALGRAAVATASLWLFPWVAALDLLFLPALVALVLPPLVRAGNRNTPLLAVLAALWATDFAFFWGLSHADAALARRALFIGIDIVLLLVTVIGGRIIPAFTSAALRQAGIASPLRAWRGMTPAAVCIMLAMTVADLWKPEGLVAGGVAAAAAAVRVFGPAVLPLPYTTVVVLAAALWTVSFVLFLRVYAPILLRPRADGKPG